MKRIVVLMISVLAFIHVGCFTFLEIVDNNYTVKSNRIAVIAGDADTNTLYFARTLTDQIKEKTNLEVIAQSAIAAAVKGYPAALQGPYKKGLASTIFDYKNTDVTQVNKIQKSLNADYVMVVWLSPDQTKLYESDNYGRTWLVQTQQPYALQLFAYPEGKEIGRGSRSINWSPDDGNVIEVSIGSSLPLNSFENAVKGTFAPHTVKDLISGLKLTKKE